MVTQTMINCY